MAARVHRKKASTPNDRNRVFDHIRKRIGEELQRPDLRVRPSSQLELAISTFAPSQVLIGFEVSDYPFFDARYVSVRDGHVYIVKGSTDDGEQIVAYRLNFIQSIMTTQGGIGVAITPDGWMESTMVMYSLTHEHFEMKGGVLQGINDQMLERRSYPIKKAHAYWAHWTRRGRARLTALPMIGKLFERKRPAPRDEGDDAELKY
ncbi:hypothetical protein LA345_36830 (plasmid) [Burkholderia vietnamiensis]|uniref:Uncharacterized protein n=1 Tax=Burkholderia vietnamiensis (strain G4 / LMG 22486) TaxID=269482 RepID=A4JV88_BURVG|nr:hypothetical protein Bcep1808_7314 [Burkholderia vietnamiensis G4]MCB4349379.1 hypothetical protein [Burkholderia vietnamiensis]